MANLENRNKKAILDIFSLEDARGVCEALGGQMDMSAPVEDDTEYTLDDMMTVNPSPDQTFGESFMQGEDDMASQETQKFVIDEFAKEAAKIPGSTIEVSDIPALATVIQAQNGIKGDVAGFLEKTMMAAEQRLTAQNTSDALPDGASAADEFGGASAEPVDMGMGMGETVPEMEPIAPSAEPTLTANDDDALNLDNFGLDETDPAGAPAEDATDDLLSGLDDADFADDLGDTTELTETPAEDEAPAEEEKPVAEEDEKPAEEETSAEEEKPAEESDEDDALFSGLDGDDEEPGDDDFKLESVYTSDSPVLESTGTEVAADVPAEEPAAEVPAEEAPAEEAPVEEAPADVAEGVEECSAKELSECKAKLESIRANYMAKYTADRVASLVESYQREHAHAEKLAKLESIVSNFKHNEQVRASVDAKNAKLESIVANYAAKANAKKTAVVEGISKASAAKASTAKAFVESATARHESHLEVQRKLNAIVEGVKANKSVQKKLDALVESVAAKTDLQKKLDAIVESVKRS